jgi:hypothetical protein
MRDCVAVGYTESWNEWGGEETALFSLSWHYFEKNARRVILRKKDKDV